VFTLGVNLGVNLAPRGEVKNGSLTRKPEKWLQNFDLASVPGDVVAVERKLEWEPDQDGSAAAVAQRIGDPEIRIRGKVLHGQVGVVLEPI
jgi:hypothetical protein